MKSNGARPPPVNTTVTESRQSPIPSPTLTAVSGKRKRPNSFGSLNGANAVGAGFGGFISVARVGEGADPAKPPISAWRQNVAEGNINGGTGLQNLRRHSEGSVVAVPVTVPVDVPPKITTTMDLDPGLDLDIVNGLLSLRNERAVTISPVDVASASVEMRVEAGSISTGGAGEVPLSVVQGSPAPSADQVRRQSIDLVSVGEQQQPQQVSASSPGEAVTLSSDQLQHNMVNGNGIESTATVSASVIAKQTNGIKPGGHSKSRTRKPTEKPSNVTAETSTTIKSTNRNPSSSKPASISTKKAASDIKPDSPANTTPSSPAADGTASSNLNSNSVPSKTWKLSTDRERRRGMTVGDWGKLLGRRTSGNKPKTNGHVNGNDNASPSRGPGSDGSGSSGSGSRSAGVNGSKMMNGELDGGSPEEEIGSARKRRRKVKVEVDTGPSVAQSRESLVTVKSGKTSSTDNGLENGCAGGNGSAARGKLLNGCLNASVQNEGVVPVCQSSTGVKLGTDKINVGDGELAEKDDVWNLISGWREGEVEPDPSDSVETLQANSGSDVVQSLTQLILADQQQLINRINKKSHQIDETNLAILVAKEKMNAAVKEQKELEEEVGMVDEVYDRVEQLEWEIEMVRRRGVDVVTEVFWEKPGDGCKEKGSGDSGCNCSSENDGERDEVVNLGEDEGNFKGEDNDEVTWRRRWRRFLVQNVARKPEEFSLKGFKGHGDFDGDREANVGAKEGATGDVAMETKDGGVKVGQNGSRKRKFKGSKPAKVSEMLVSISRSDRDANEEWAEVNEILSKRRKVESVKTPLPTPSTSTLEDEDVTIQSTPLVNGTTSHKSNNEATSSTDSDSETRAILLSKIRALESLAILGTLSVATLQAEVTLEQQRRDEKEMRYRRVLAKCCGVDVEDLDGFLRPLFFEG
ncbi:hypothetical protein HDU76_012775 [Blyttiomyces sp. JEL0837]|nr:hypothetical protein HDU76_012775 [Blyttiomyces sp. JEL0837]